MKKEESLTPDALRALAEKTTATPQQRLAAYQRLKSLKLAGAEDYEEAYKLYREKIGEASAADFLKDIDFKKDLDKSERRIWFAPPKEDAPDIGIAARQRLVRTMAEEGELEVKWEKDGHGNIVEAKNEIFAGAKLFMSKENREKSRSEVGASLDRNEKKAVGDFLQKASEKKLVESYSLLSDLKIPNPEHIDGSPFNTGNDLEKKIAKKEGEDFLKLISGLYDAQGNEMAIMDPDKNLIFKTLDTVMGKRQEKAKKQFLRNMARNPKATPEQLAAVRALAGRYSVDIDGKDDDDKGGDKTKTPKLKGPPDGMGAFGISAPNPNNTLDLRSKPDDIIET
jgi:hypothetical protein